MVSPKLCLASLYHLHLQLLSLVPPALIPKRRRKVGHAYQRVGMVSPKLRLASLHHLHLQLLSLVPPALIPKRRRKVGHAYQRVGMVSLKLRLASLHHLHKQLLRLLPPALIIVYPAKHAAYKIRMPLSIPAYIDKTCVNVW